MPIGIILVLLVAGGMYFLVEEKTKPADSPPLPPNIPQAKFTRGMALGGGWEVEDMHYDSTSSTWLYTLAMYEPVAGVLLVMTRKYNVPENEVTT